MAVGDTKQSSKFSTILEIIAGIWAKYVAAVGNRAHGAADSGYGGPVKVGGVYNTTPTAVDTGDRADLQTDSYGHVKKVGAYLTKSTTIPQGAGETPEIDLEGFTLVAVVIPTGWTNANLSLVASPTTGGTFRAVYDSGGTAVSLTVGTGNKVVVPTYDQDIFGALRFIKLVATANQASLRNLTLILKG
jgi:hypothetical protein